jgi:glycolate oxidase FAD binding subunit
MSGFARTLEPPAGLLGADSLLPPDTHAGYAIDGLIPRWVVRPANRREAAQILGWASSEGSKVAPWGGGTQISLGNPPEALHLVLDLSRLDQVVDFQPADLTVTVEAGITLESLQRHLASAGKFLPVEAPLAGRATVGGILATGSVGPLRHAYGLPRDWLIGIRVISPAGDETKAGGRVVKNVTGYDLNKLYTGSLGTLGVIAEATFKLAPLPANPSALVASFPSVQRGIEAGLTLSRQVFAPQGLQVLNGAASRRLELAPETPTPESSPPEAAMPATVLAFFAGRPQALSRRLTESANLLTRVGATGVEQIQDADALALLRGVTDLGLAEETGPESVRPHLVLKINLPPAASLEMSSWLQADPIFGGSNASPHVGSVVDVGFGGIHLLCWGPSVGTAEDIRRLRKTAGKLGGSVVVERCPLAWKRELDVWGDLPLGIDAGMEIMRRLKNKFDPHRTLNPGRFLGGLV